MTEVRRIPKPKSPQEWRVLKNRKLATFALIVILVLHALPGPYLPEAFPLYLVW
ncbi:MAG: hypothetical protein AAFN11_06910 [Chloroflexota bacterium]